MTLAEFLLARIAEDEAVVADMSSLTQMDWEFADDAEPAIIAIGWTVASDVQPRAAGLHIARHDPARVLAECEAKRRLLVEVEQCRSMIPAHVQGDGDEHDAVIVDWCEGAVLPLLALPYADHPDYDPDWNV